MVWSRVVVAALRKADDEFLAPTRPCIFRYTFRSTHRSIFVNRSKKLLECISAERRRAKQINRVETDPKEELEVDMMVEVGIGLSQEGSPLVLGKAVAGDLEPRHGGR